MPCEAHAAPLCICKTHGLHMYPAFPKCQVQAVTYLLGLLAMIKCSICSYQCDNWYVSNWRLACHMNFWSGQCDLELAQVPARVALAWHLAGRSTPSGVTTLIIDLWFLSWRLYSIMCCGCHTVSKHTVSHCSIRSRPSAPNAQHHSVHFITHQSFAFY